MCAKPSPWPAAAPSAASRTSSKGRGSSATRACSACLRATARRTARCARASSSFRPAGAPSACSRRSPAAAEDLPRLDPGRTAARGDRRAHRRSRARRRRRLHAHRARSQLRPLSRHRGRDARGLPLPRDLPPAARPRRRGRRARARRPVRARVAGGRPARREDRADEARDRHLRLDRREGDGRRAGAATDRLGLLEPHGAAHAPRDRPDRHLRDRGLRRQPAARAPRGCVEPLQHVPHQGACRRGRSRTRGATRCAPSSSRPRASISTSSRATTARTSSRAPMRSTTARSTASSGGAGGVRRERPSARATKRPAAYCSATSRRSARLSSAAPAPCTTAV